MTTIGFIRHGITPWNIEKRAQGSADIPLHEEGIETAKKVAVRLANEKWNVIYSSPQLRARQTAEIILEKLPHAELKFDDRLREKSGGEIEGTTEEERLEKWGEGWRDLDLGMETNEQVVERGLSFIEDIRCSGEEHVLIVSHGGFILNLLRALTPEREYTEALNNTSLTILELDEERNNCVLFNCTKHLV
jgi:probable phosphoglycerate mutase